MFKFFRRPEETREVSPPSNAVEQLARVLKWEHDGYSRFKKCLQPYSTKYSQLYLKRPTKVANISYKEALTFANGSNLTIWLVRETDQIEVIGFHDVPATRPNGKTYANCGIKSQRIGLRFDPSEWYVRRVLIRLAPKDPKCWNACRSFLFARAGSDFREEWPSSSAGEAAALLRSGGPRSTSSRRP